MEVRGGSKDHAAVNTANQHASAVPSKLLCSVPRIDQARIWVHLLHQWSRFGTKMVWSVFGRSNACSTAWKDCRVQRSSKFGGAPAARDRAERRTGGALAVVPVTLRSDAPPRNLTLDPVIASTYNHLRALLPTFPCSVANPSDSLLLNTVMRSNVASC